jgi:hypothetical protein
MILIANPPLALLRSHSCHGSLRWCGNAAVAHIFHNQRGKLCAAMDRKGSLRGYTSLSSTGTAAGVDALRLSGYRPATEKPCRELGARNTKNRIAEYSSNNYGVQLVFLGSVFQTGFDLQQIGNSLLKTFRSRHRSMNGAL